MKFSDIILNDVTYDGSLIKHKGEKLFFTIPEMGVESIDDKNGKYSLKLEFDIQNRDHKLLYNFIKKFEEKNKTQARCSYKSIINLEGTRLFLYLKLPYRFRRFEVSIQHKSGLGIYSVGDLKKGMKVECNIEASKLWFVKMDDGEKLSGGLIMVRDITINCV